MAKRREFSLVAAALLVAGCASPGQESGSMLGDIGRSVQGVVGAVSGIFDHRTRELREAVEAGQFEHAAYLYELHERSYDAAKVAELLARTARGLNEKWAPRAASLAQNLAVDAASAAPEGWDKVKQALAEGREFIQGYDGVRLLRRPEYRAREIADLEARITGLESSFSSAADGHFARYPHGSEPPLFFDRYPVQLSGDLRERLVRENFETWVSAAREAEAPVSPLVESYGPALKDSAQREALAQAVADGLARREGWRPPHDFPRLLELSRAAARAVPGTQLLASQVALLVVADAAARPPWDGSRAGLKSFEASLIELPRRLQALRESFAHVIVVDPWRTALVDRTMQFAMRDSQRVVGKREEPNPDWERARQSFESSQADLAKAEADNQQLQRQAGELARAYDGRGIGALGAVLGTGLGTWAVESARSSIQQARQELASTPQTVWKDVMEPYRYAAARRDRTLVHQVGLYLADSRSGMAKRALLEESKARSATVLRGLDRRDPDRGSLEAASAKELAEIESLGAQSLPIGPEDLLGRLSRHGEFTELKASSLPAAVLGDRKRFESDKALEQARARQDSREADRQLAQVEAPPERGVEQHRLAGLRAGMPAKRPAAVQAAADAAARVALCPRDMRHLASRMRMPEAMSHLGQPIRDMIGKAGGVDRAIAMSHAQMREFESTRSQARTSAIQAYGGPGAPLQAPCRSAEGIYCASANAYFLMKDSILYTNEVVKALSCYKTAGVR